MSEEKVLKLRANEELVNTVKVVGYLKAKTIEEGKTSDNKGYIRGSLSVLTSDTQTTTVDFYFGKETKEGNISKLYENAKKLKEYVSIVDLIEGKVEDVKAKDEEEAKALCDIVQINGNINPNEYINENDELVSRPKINGKFFHRIDKANVKYDTFGAFFEADIFFKSIKPETKNNIETGRAVIEAVVPTSINPAIVGAMTFYVTKDEGAADFILDNYSKKQTGSVYGEFVVTRTEEKTSGGFGAKNKASSDSVSFEWIITGGEKRQYDEESKNAFDIEVLKEALAQRLEYAKEQKAKKKDKSAKGGFGARANVSNNISKKQADSIASKFDDEDF